MKMKTKTRVKVMTMKKRRRTKMRKVATEEKVNHKLVQALQIFKLHHRVT